MLLPVVYINHPNQTKRSVPKCRRIYVLPPPPPKNRDKSKNLRSVKTALRASTLSALGILIALAVLLPNAAAEAQTSPASTATATAITAPATTDYDSDNDGLIDIKTLAQLNAVRYDLDGDGKQGSVSATDWAIYTTAFPNPASGMGCKLTGTPQQPTCDGYELMPKNLDFDTNGDGEVNSSDTYPNWTPIGTATSEFTRFNTTFKGNIIDGAMSKISNLTIKGSATKDVGLFGATGPNASIENVGLVDVNVDITASVSNARIGALVGNNAGEVIACYSTGKISADAGTYSSYGGGLVAFNTGTIAAAFSRATVNMSSTSETYAGGLTGYNNGTITATYSAGAVKGKGNINSRVGGLVGQNDETITASYSIAPVTAATGIINAGGGLVGYNDRTKGGAITASYWDYITSGIDDTSPTTMPQGKSTSDLTSSTPTSSTTSIYADWVNLTIDSAVDPAPWVFDDARFHPLLTYGGHTTAISGNQLFVNGGIPGPYGGNTIHPREGMDLYSNIRSYGRAFVRALRSNPSHTWTWQGSTDGINWTTLAPIHGMLHRVSFGTDSTFRFVLRPENVGKYIRAKIGVRTGGYAYTRVIGKIKAAVPGSTAALGFTSDDAPLVGTAITASLPSDVDEPDDAAALWYRCDANSANPPSTGCELVGSRVSYIPGASDLGHYLHAYIYYKQSNAWVRASTGFTKKVGEDIRRGQWR